MTDKLLALVLLSHCFSLRGFGKVEMETRIDRDDSKHLPERDSMGTVVKAPLTMVEAVAALRLPPRADQRLQILMDRNTDGALLSEQREELEALVELSEEISLVRAQALQVLGRKPA